MITKENLKECFDSLTESEINLAFNEEPYNYIEFWVHSFNAGCYASISCCDYTEEKHEECISNGMIFCDKDDFLRLFEESGSVNQFLMELV